MQISGLWEASTQSHGHMCLREQDETPRNWFWEGVGEEGEHLSLTTQQDSFLFLLSFWVSQFMFRWSSNSSNNYLCSSTSAHNLHCPNWKMQTMMGFCSKPSSWQQMCLCSFSSAVGGLIMFGNCLSTICVTHKEYYHARFCIGNLFLIDGVAILSMNRGWFLKPWVKWGSSLVMKKLG